MVNSVNSTGSDEAQDETDSKIDIVEDEEPDLLNNTIKNLKKWFRFCKSDDSNTCMSIAVATFAVICGATLALVITHSKILNYFRPPPWVPPEKFFSVDYLWPGSQYDFFKDKETHSNAKRICDYYNTTLLYFNSSQEEKEFDCYMNVRNNAEDKQVTLWLNETIIFGGPLKYARLGSFFSEDRQAVIRKTKQVLEENGCDVQKSFANRQAIWLADQENNQTETVYNMAKVYGNYGLRHSNQGSTNGCWNLIRSNATIHVKSHFACKQIIKTPVLMHQTLPGAHFLSSKAGGKLFSEIYCGS